MFSHNLFLSGANTALKSLRHRIVKLYQLKEKAIHEMIEKLKATMQIVEELSFYLEHPITKDDYYIEDLGCPHNPTGLPKGYAGVYMFFEGETALKIGKANAKSNARFRSQHYGFNAPSTLAKSICADHHYQQIGISNKNCSEWIKKNTHRINILVKASCGKAATELIEAILHYQYRPKYEGSIQ